MLHVCWTHAMCPMMDGLVSTPQALVSPPWESACLGQLPAESTAVQDEIVAETQALASLWSLG